MHGRPGLARRCRGLRFGGIGDGRRLESASQGSLTGVSDPRDEVTLPSWAQERTPPDARDRIGRLGTRPGFDVRCRPALVQCWHGAVVTTRRPVRAERCDPDVRG